MDERDIRILSAIANQKTGSPDAIAESSGIPKSTVHYRIQQLKEDGILKNDLLEIDIEGVGLSLTLITEVWAEFEQGYHETVGKALAEIEGVNQVHFTLGDTDFVVVSHLSSRQRVERLVEQFESIDGIERTSSKFVITTLKQELNPIANYEIDTLLEMLLDS